MQQEVAVCNTSMSSSVLRKLTLENLQISVDLLESNSQIP